MKDRSTLKALVAMAIILAAPIAMLFLAYCASHTRPAKPPAPKPTISVRSV